MKYKAFGNTDIKVPVICQGSLGVGSRKNSNSKRIQRRIDTLKYGLDLGMNVIDTGEDYEGGHAEEVLAKLLKIVPRDDVIIASKLMPKHNSFKGILKAFEGSLQRLGTDYIDLYQLQWPNPQIPIEESMSALEKLVDEGKVRHIGVGNLGWHRVGVKQASSIKSREYAARGIPFIYAANDLAFGLEFAYSLEVQSDDTPIDVQKLIDFAINVHKEPDVAKKIRDYASINLDWSIQIKKIISEIETIK